MGVWREGGREEEGRTPGGGMEEGGARRGWREVKEEMKRGNGREVQEERRR